MKNWKTIWNNKGAKQNTSIKEIMDVNGFNNTGVTYQVYEKFWKHVNEVFNIKEPTSFYEIGCGAGLSLKILHDNMNHKVGGSDFAENSILTAETWNLSEDIKCMEAINVSTNDKYDYVVSFSVFHYFKDLEYTQKVLQIMLDKSNKGIGVFDICDEEKKDIYVETRKSNNPDYEKLYSGLDHLFFPKSFWENFAKLNDLKIIIEDQHIDNYKNSKLRYNVYLTK